MPTQGPLDNLDRKTRVPFVTKRVITDLARTAPYLVRWSLWLPFGLSLKLHRIVRADDDRCNHDHPWWFVRIILAGGYVEQQGDDNRIVTLRPWRPWAPWRVYFCPSNFRHRILSLANGRSSWSLVLCGRRIKEWGFYTSRGWMHWRSFVDAAHENRVLWCDDGSRVQLEGDRRPTPATLNDFACLCHAANERWWHDLETGERLDRNKGELLMLVVSEISEAMEGERKDLMDDKLPHRRMAEVELADALIRIFDYAGGHGYDLDGAFLEKMAFNATRHDHTQAGRLAAGGKKW